VTVGVGVAGRVVATEPGQGRGGVFCGKGMTAVVPEFGARRVGVGVAGLGVSGRVTTTVGFVSPGCAPNDRSCCVSSPAPKTAKITKPTIATSAGNFGALDRLFVVIIALQNRWTAAVRKTHLDPVPLPTCLLEAEAVPPEHRCPVRENERLCLYTGERCEWPPQSGRRGREYRVFACEVRAAGCLVPP
jgi:hypothetical protein